MKVPLTVVSTMFCAVCVADCARGQAAATSSESALIISVPVLVETSSGDLAYDLTTSEFSLKDNGLVQEIRLDNNTSDTALSLVFVIQTGHGAGGKLEAATRLGAFIDSVLKFPRDQAALIGFDSRPQVLQGLSSSPEDIASALGSLIAGNSGSTLFDAVHLAEHLLQGAPVENRRVILLISGEHDHGSNASDTESLVRDVSANNVSIYSLCFRPGTGSLLGKLRSFDVMAMTASAMRRNSPEALAQMSGGEFYRFNSKKAFEDRSIEIAKHINNRYILSLHPSRPQPGFHSIEIGVNYPSLRVVSARRTYWIGESLKPSGGPDQR